MLMTSFSVCCLLFGKQPIPKSSFPSGAPLDKTKFSLQVVINWELMKLNFKCIQLLNPFDLLVGLVLYQGRISHYQPRLAWSLQHCIAHSGLLFSILWHQPPECWHFQIEKLAHFAMTLQFRNVAPSTHQSTQCLVSQRTLPLRTQNKACSSARCVAKYL